MGEGGGDTKTVPFRQKKEQIQKDKHSDKWIVEDIKFFNPITVGGGGEGAQHPPYSFIALTHIKVKQMTSNDLTIPLWQ